MACDGSLARNRALLVKAIWNCAFPRGLAPGPGGDCHAAPFLNLPPSPGCQAHYRMHRLDRSLLVSRCYSRYDNRCGPGLTFLLAAARWPRRIGVVSLSGDRVPVNPAAISPPSECPISLWRFVLSKNDDAGNPASLSLAEAIRLGSLLMPNPAAGETRTCAIGMALLAHGSEPEGALDYQRLMAIYPWLRKYRRRCPRCGIRLRYTGVLAHVFDRHVMKHQVTLDWFCQWLAESEGSAAIALLADLADDPPNPDPGARYLQLYL